MIDRDGHVRLLPLHVANKIAAGEVVERPASVVKELVENAIDAGAKNIRISITQGGRKLVAVQDDGCGMTKDDAVLALERQATSKIRDVNDIEEIDTLGFRGEAIPSIASVSRFTLTTRRHDSDEGTLIQVNAGELAEVRAAGCPPGTLVEVRDLFCNVPARRKFLRAYATEENHVKQIFTVHALAHPAIGFSLTVDGRELYRLAPAAAVTDRILDLFGPDFVAQLLPMAAPATGETPSHGPLPVKVTGYIERPNRFQPTRRDQYVFVNGRPATAPSIAYAIREAYPRHQGDVKPAAVIFIELKPNQVDVNVHPTKREVRFRDNTAVKNAIITAIESAIRGIGSVGSIGSLGSTKSTGSLGSVGSLESLESTGSVGSTESVKSAISDPISPNAPTDPIPPKAPTDPNAPTDPKDPKDPKDPNAPKDPKAPISSTPPPAPAPTPLEFAIESDSTGSKPWKWFKFLASTDSGYVIIETDSGLVTINPHAARERIAFEKLLYPSPTPHSDNSANLQSNNPNNQTIQTIQSLLIPETVQLSPIDFARIQSSLGEIASMGFVIEEFGQGTFKIDAVPQLIGELSPAAVLATIARDLAEGGARRGGARWKEEIIAKSIARSFAGMSLALTEKGAVQLVEELCACRMPYVCPRGKPVMIFTSTRELDRKFAK